MNQYYIYILTNFDKTVLYTGVTNNLKRRLQEHKSGINKNSFTSIYKCFYLPYFDNFASLEQAIDREKQRKGRTRAKKNLISDFNKEWKFLNDGVLQ